VVISACRSCDDRGVEVTPEAMARPQCSGSPPRQDHERMALYLVESGEELVEGMLAEPCA
jgi:hypothetical protein